MINKGTISLILVLMFGTLNAQNNQHNMDVVVKLLSERKAAIVRDKSELGKIDQQIRRFGELGEKKKCRCYERNL